MEPQEILAALDEPYAPYQREAVEAAVAQQGAVTPWLLARLRSLAAEPRQWLDEPGPGAIYLLVLLAHFQEPRAHRDLLSLASLPEELAEPLLGDAITELLAPALWATSGGETTGLRALAQDRSAYGFGRGAAIDALVMAVHRGELEAEGVKADLAEWLADDRFAAPGDPAWGCLMFGLLSLYAEEQGELMRRRASEGYLQPEDEREMDFVFGHDREEWLAEERRSTERRFPADVHDYLANWASLQPGFWDEPEGQSPLPRQGPASKPAAPDPKKKKHKRKQQQKGRKANRKKRK